MGRAVVEQEGSQQGQFPLMQDRRSIRGQDQRLTGTDYPMEVTKSEFYPRIWSDESRGRHLGLALSQISGGVTRVVAATDNPRKLQLYALGMGDFSHVWLGNSHMRIDALTHEQKRSLGSEPSWSNVMYVAANKNGLALDAIAGTPGGSAMMISTDILTGVVKPGGERRMYHKLGREANITREILDVRLEELQEVLSINSTWFWLEAFTAQTKQGLLLAGRYYEVDYNPIDSGQVANYFWRDVQVGRAQSIPQALDVLSYFPQYALGAGKAIGVTQAMMEEDTELSRGVLWDHVERSLYSGQATDITVPRVNATVYSGIPGLDGQRDVYVLNPSKALHLQKTMTSWPQD